MSSPTIKLPVILAFAVLLFGSIVAGCLAQDIGELLNGVKKEAQYVKDRVEIGIALDQVDKFLNGPGPSPPPASPPPSPPSAAAPSPDPAPQAPPPPSAATLAPVSAEPSPPQPQVFNNVTGYAWDPPTGRLVIIRGNSWLSDVIDVGPGGARINWATGIEGPPDMLSPGQEGEPWGQGGSGSAQGQANTPACSSTEGQQASIAPANAPGGAPSPPHTGTVPDKSQQSLPGAGPSAVVSPRSGGIKPYSGPRPQSSAPALTGNRGNAVGPKQQATTGHKVTNVPTGSGALGSSPAAAGSGSQNSRMINLQGTGTAQPVGTHGGTGTREAANLPGARGTPGSSPAAVGSGSQNSRMINLQGTRTTQPAGIPGRSTSPGGQSVTGGPRVQPSTGSSVSARTPFPDARTSAAQVSSQTGASRSPASLSQFNNSNGASSTRQSPRPPSAVSRPSGVRAVAQPRASQRAAPQSSRQQGATHR